MKALVILGVSVVAIVLLLVLSVASPPSEEDIRRGVVTGDLPPEVSEKSREVLIVEYKQECSKLSPREAADCLDVYYHYELPELKDARNGCTDNCDSYYVMMSQYDAAYCNAVVDPLLKSECEVAQHE